jgi:hypothetical protein
LRHTLEGAQKFTAKIDDDLFRTRAESRLFGSAETKVVLWSDLKRAAAVQTHWPLHKLSALDDLKAECLRRGLWREEGNHVRRGPFPPPVPEVVVRELSVQEEGPGYTYLKIEPLHAPAVVFETGSAEPTGASTPVPTPTSVGTATYDGPFRVPTHCRVVCAIAVAPEYNLNSEPLRIQIPQKGGAERPLIDLTHPARWTQPTKLDDSGAVWDIVGRLELAAGVIAHDISLTAESADGQQNVEYSGALDSGFDAPAVKAVAEKLQDIVSVGNLRMTVGSLAFPYRAGAAGLAQGHPAAIQRRQGEPGGQSVWQPVWQPI